MVKITKFINFPILICSFIVGLIFVNLSKEPAEKINVYPTPDNVDDIEYLDKASNCYAYQSTKINCPKDGIKYTPVQE